MQIPTQRCVLLLQPSKNSPLLDVSHEPEMQNLFIPHAVTDLDLTKRSTEWRAPSHEIPEQIQRHADGHDEEKILEDCGRCTRAFPHRPVPHVRILLVLIVVGELRRIRIDVIASTTATILREQ